MPPMPSANSSTLVSSTVALSLSFSFLPLARYFIAASMYLLPSLVSKSTEINGIYMQGVKRAIKREVKAEPLSSTPSTPITIAQRPRAVSAEMSLRKRPGADTRALNALNAPTEEDAEEEQLEKLLQGNAGAGEA